MLRPYPSQGIPEEQRIDNYRLFRARRVIENAFGILAVRWGVFMLPVQSTVEKADRLVKATICLHNFLGRQIVQAIVRRVSLILVTKLG